MDSSHAGGGVHRPAAEASMLQLSSRAAFLLVQQDGTAEGLSIPQMCPTVVQYPLQHLNVEMK